MSEARLLVGDVFDVLETLDDECVDLVLTSPPFLGLRSYLPDGHADKRREIGSETDPAEFLDTLLRLVARLDRVLAPHGSLCVELGDCFAGSGGAGGDYNEGGLREGQEKFDGSARRGRNRQQLADGRTIQGNGISNGQPRTGSGWPLNKSLCGIPTLFAWSLAYGRNLLTGEPSPAGRWIVRNVVVWARPNPPVGQLYDKFRPGTSYLTVATRDPSRFFDLDAVRVPNKSENVSGRGTDAALNGREGDNDGFRNSGYNPNGTPPNDWWEPWPIEQALWDWWGDQFVDEIWNIASAPYSGSHYAVFPPMLCVRPIKTMCPERVCRQCGKPSERIVESTRYATDGTVLDYDFTKGDRSKGLRQMSASDGGPSFSHVERVDKGWTDCGHDDWRAGVVLDPFAGSGTTLAVATGHGRDAIGIDLDERNADLCRARIGMFLSDIVLPLKDATPPDPDESIAAMF